MADTPKTGTPGEYMPVLAQNTSSDPSNKDAENAAKIANRNRSSSAAGATSNNLTVNPAVPDGKLYLNREKPMADVLAAQIVTEVPTVVGTQGPKGDRGDRGPAGPAGPTGADGVVDMDALRDLIQQMIDDALNFKDFQFVKPTPAQVFGTKSISLPVEYIDKLAETSVVVSASYSITPNTVGTINSAGLFTASDVATDTSVTVVANYTDSKGKNFTASTVVAIKAFKVSALAIAGPASVNSAGSATYVATAVYTDASTKVVTVDSGTTWSIQSGAIGTLNKNVLTAGIVSADTAGVIKAVYVEKGTTVQATKSVTIAAPALVSYYGTATHPVSSTSADPALYANWGAFTQALSGQNTSGSKNFTFSTSQGVDQYAWLAYPKSYGLLDQAKIKGAGQPGPGGWDSAKAPNARTGSAWGVSGPLEINVTINGASVAFYLYRSDNKVSSGTFTESWTISA